VLLTGSREAGEDLLQTAVERLLQRWRRFDGDPEGYLRRTLCNLAIDSRRRAGRWRQKEGLLRTGLRQTQDATGEVDLRDVLVRLLWQLPVRQRARSRTRRPGIRSARLRAGGRCPPVAVPVGASALTGPWWLIGSASPK
jgi:Sigma-70 region 2